MKRIISLYLILLIPVFLTLIYGRVYGRDLDGRYANSPNHDWFLSLHSKKGAPCCADADGIRVLDPDWDSKDGHYRVRLENKWYDVPPDAVLDQPNVVGPTMVWRSYINGQPNIICFLPGAGG